MHAKLLCRVYLPHNQKTAMNTQICQKHQNANNEKFEKKYRLADFFNAHWEDYLSLKNKPLVTYEQYKAVTAIRVCRTAVLGADHYVCDECGDVSEVFHNCRNRFCPTCSWGDTMKWADKMKSQMLDLEHRHTVFTLPHALNGLVKRNGKELLNILLRTAADTLKDWAKHKHNITIGVISVLHTYGETKGTHFHVHMIVSWGGIENGTGKLKPILGKYVNYDFLKTKFRCKFEDALVALYNSKMLKHDFRNKVAFLSFLKRINQKQWIIHMEDPMPNPTAVIRYIGRYSKRACLSEYKITEIDGDFISFIYKDYKTIDQNNKPVERTLTLHYKDFFPRLLQHVPLRYFRMVRYYGLYATKTSLPEAYLSKNLESDEDKLCEMDSPFVCTFCKKDKVYLYTVFDKRVREERLKAVFDINIHPSYIHKRHTA